MNIRVFLLIVTTALFAAVWSSDQQYQEIQVAAARAARPRATESEMAARVRRVVPSHHEPWIPVSPFAGNSWVAANVAVPSLPEAVREPVIAPRAIRNVLPERIAPSKTVFATVFAIVSFRKPSFHFDGGCLSSEVREARTANPEAPPETDLSSILRWVERVRFEVNGQTCWMRWEMRRTAHSAQHRMIALFRQQLHWRDLVQTLARGMLLRLDRPATNAAVPGTAEER